MHTEQLECVSKMKMYMKSIYIYKQRRPWLFDPVT